MSVCHLINGTDNTKNGNCPLLTHCYLRPQLINSLHKGQTPKKCQFLCNYSSIKDAYPSVALTAPQQHNVSYSPCSVFLSPCILHVCLRKTLHYGCDMLAYNDVQHSICSGLNSTAVFHTELRAQSELA